MNSTLAFGSVGSTIRLRSGKYFDLANPKPDQFEFADIAVALSRLPRFNGQCGADYKVAEHCCRCAFQSELDGCGNDEYLAVLMHDAAEAFVGDMTRPLKGLIGPLYSAIEKAVQNAIGERFGIDFQRHAALIKEIDNAMLIAERRHWFTADGVEWAGEKTARVLTPKFNVAPWAAWKCEEVFTNEALTCGLLP